MASDEETQTDNSAAPPSLIERLGLALMGEPGTRAQLVEVLRDAQSRNLLDRDALDMIEGVLQVSEMQVRDIWCRARRWTWRTSAARQRSSCR